MTKQTPQAQPEKPTRTRNANKPLSAGDICDRIRRGRAESEVRLRESEAALIARCKPEEKGILEQMMSVTGLGTTGI